MSQNEKKFFKRLSVDKKVEIVRRVENGERQMDLAEEYGVSKSAVSYIVSKKETIKDFEHMLKQQNGRSDKRTRASGVENNRVEMALFTWFTQKRMQGELISGPLLKEKALQFNAEVGGSSTFKASNGWLSRFKSRHQIRQISVEEEKLPQHFPDTSADPDGCTDDIVSMGNLIPGNKGFSKEDIEQWILIDKDLPTCYIKGEGEEEEEDEENTSTDDDTDEEPIPSLEVVLTSLNNIRAWFESRNDATFKQIADLNNIRQLVLREIYVKKSPQ